MNRNLAFLHLLTVLALVFSAQRGFAQSAAEVIEASDFQGGVAVHVGCGDGTLASIPLPMRENTSMNFAPSLVVNSGVVVYTGGEKPVRDYGSREKMYGLSTDDGQKLWEAYHPASGYRSPEDLFVIGGCVWSGDVTAHRWAGEAGATGVFYGTDIKQGAKESEFGADKDAYWFHHRCHPAKATEDYLLMSRTGIEFIDLKHKSWTLHHWVRGACLYGIMPANGLIYAPQHPCACYIGGKLFGLNALAAKSEDSVVLRPSPEKGRLTRGEASDADFSRFGHDDQWPTYRGDNRRSGAAGTDVADALKQTWSVKLPGIATPPVIAGGKVLLSLKNKQALYALDADSGQTVYRYFPGGRIDSPPAVHGNRIYFGCTDGFVYCLSLDDGALVWKFQAVPVPTNHMYFEHVESTHPVHGTVLVRDGKVYTVSGRSMFVDGGMRFSILDAKTGEKMAEHVMDDKVPGTDEPLQMNHEFLNMPMAMPDILSCNGDKIFMRYQEFDLDGNRLELDFSRKLYAKEMRDKDRSFESLQDQKGKDAHLFSGTGFLDDSWWHRTYWVYGKHYGSGWPGYYLAGKSTPAGRILSFDDSGIYGWGRLKQYFKWSKPYQYMLFATDYDYQQQWAVARVDNRNQSGCHGDFVTYLHATRCAAQFSGAVHRSDVHIYQDQRLDKDHIAWKAEKEAKPLHQYEWEVLLDAIRNDTPHNETERAIHANLAAVMGRAAVHSGKVITWEEALASEFQFVDNVDDLDYDSPAPVQADEQGRYPVPIPGQWKEI